MKTFEEVSALKMRLFILSLLGLIATVQCAILSGSRATDAYTALLKGYDKRARPDGKGKFASF